MAVQTCGTCKGTKTVDGEGWEELWVWMCEDCVSGEQRTDEPCEADTDVELFERIDALRQGIQSENAGRLLGMTGVERSRGQRNFDRLNTELDWILSNMTIKQMRGYTAHRKALAS